MGTPTVARLSLWGLGVLLFLALLEGGLCGLHLGGVPRDCPSPNPLKVGWESPLAENFIICLGGELDLCRASK